MPSVAQILQMRQRQRLLESRQLAGKLGLILALLLSLAFAVVGIALSLAYANLSQDLPSIESLPSLLDPIGKRPEPTRLFDRSGKHVLYSYENPASIGAQYLPVHASGNLSETEGIKILPQGLISATLAISDPQFWQHPGFTFEDISQGSPPTLAQRVISGRMLADQTPGIRQTLRNRLLAAQITHRFGRDKVLEWFLNNANYGRLAYGADAAARVYFGKPANKLTLAESALLAAVADAPALNPHDAPQAAYERQRQVIQKMLEGGWITQAQAVAALNETVVLRPAEQSKAEVAPAFVRKALEQLRDQFDQDELARGGLRVITSLDYDLQKQVECAADVQIARLENAAPATQALSSQPCPAARLLPTLPFSSQPVTQTQQIDAGVVILDPRTGEVLAMAGAPQNEFDPAQAPGRPVGSLVSPFIYLTALTRGFSPASLVWDTPSSDPRIDQFASDGKFHGPMRLRSAVANDYIIPIYKLFQQVGGENITNTLRQTGLFSQVTEDDLPNGGSSEFSGLWELPVTLLDSTRAFGILANDGKLAGRMLETDTAPGQIAPIQPAYILRIENQTNQNILDWSTPHTRPVISSQLAYLVSHVLSDEAARWPGLGHPNSLEIGRPAAAKIGRTETGQDGWTVGYLPQLALGVWFGASGKPASAQSSTEANPALEANGALSNSNLSKAAAGLWHALMQYASRDLPPQSWSVPAGVSTISVCDPSGLLPTRDCPSVVSEVFLPGTEPTQADTLYRRMSVNRENGKLATALTPTSLIEDRIFLTLPQEALEWAEEVGLPIPPDEYDVILGSQTGSQNVHIDSPESFSAVKGQVNIIGTAAGENFDYYQLLIGEGTTPRAWFQVGEQVNEPVEDGLLGVWESTNQGGLYAIQLLVVNEDQHVETATIYLTVDNQPPVILILAPEDGEVLDSQVVLLRAEAHDDLAVKSVEFYIDNRLLAKLEQLPYTTPWRATPGSHTLRVRAMDRTGNETDTSITFTIR